MAPRSFDHDLVDCAEGGLSFRGDLVLQPGTVDALVVESVN